MTLTDLDSRNGCRRVLSLCGNWASSLRLSSGSQVDLRGGVATVKMTGSRCNSSCGKVAEQLSYTNMRYQPAMPCVSKLDRGLSGVVLTCGLQRLDSGRLHLWNNLSLTIRSAVRHWPLNEHVRTPAGNLSFRKAMDSIRHRYGPSATPPPSTYCTY